MYFLGIHNDWYVVVFAYGAIWPILTNPDFSMWWTLLFSCIAAVLIHVQKRQDFKACDIDSYHAFVWL